MLSFILTSKRLLSAFFHAFKDKEFQALFFITAITLVSGTMFYRSAEGWSTVDALYFCVTTLTTVGSSLEPQSDYGKIFTMIYVFVGIGIIFGFIRTLASHIRIGRR
ncbi:MULTISPECIES: potassium channel family protein [unclassified Paenibacillus]|uniref:potassium channel family protein n=1 Tax=unclassified Paenibacillus TaxID=185978 RepID=UPI000954B858|nr:MULTISPECIES: potassium channel family protein [unclassified Paenibacillus]ASS67127.1 two pore domain potassium channel family protein [Paenibacillus sp. RUD330]SIQ89063.1 Ion channel [Paenibacillus sp. RU4X]SIR09961.1 Ion channel [Paenibacillus sp. RU4T]